MKHLIVVSLLFLTLYTVSKAEELSLFDFEGDAIAYIADDSEMTIFLWDGTPCAYLVKKGNSENPKTDKFSIYGFNGDHLGWLIKGIVRDHEGDITGFTRGAINKSTNYEPYKSYKQYKPYKGYKEYEPYMPYLSNNWSDFLLKDFLKEGIE